MAVHIAGKKILVVDDEADLREILREELQSHGAIVIEAVNGRVALELCLKDKPDLIISDIRMPGGDGIEMLEQLRRNLGENAPCVFFVTGFSDLTPQKAVALGATGMLPKPFSLLALSQTLNRHFEPKA